MIAANVSIGMDYLDVRNGIRSSFANTVFDVFYPITVESTATYRREPDPPKKTLVHKPLTIRQMAKEVIRRKVKMFLSRAPQRRNRNLHIQ